MGVQIPREFKRGGWRRWCLWSMVWTAAGLAFFWWVVLGLVPAPFLFNPGNTSKVILDRDGGMVRITLTGDEKYRVWTPLAEISEAAVSATLEYEDRWFWYHPGVNPVALVRALWFNLLHRAERPLGASTLTMQLVRKRFRTDTRSLSGKLWQIWMALVLERHTTKREILEAYLNTAPYGANIEGLGAAARIYYRVPAARLSAKQAKVLALVPQNPAKRGPTTAVNQERLSQVWQREFPQERFDRIFAGRAELQLNAPHFVDRVALLAGARGEVRTTLAPVMQRLSERMLKDFLARNRALGFLNGTVMIVDSRTMEVLAYVGSAGYTDSAIQGYVNGLAALRSPGSVLKPFIYALAIDQGLITTDTLLKDTPLRIANYQPENFERNFLGPLSATEALVRSRNIPAIALTRSLKKPGLYGFLKQAAFLLPRAEEYYGLSLALGTFEVSMEQVLAAYAMLSGGRGVYRPLSWFGPSKEQGVRLLSAESAYLVWRMLRQNPRPNQLFGARTFGRDGPVAWKTGTSFRARDAWAVGIADALVVGVWLGNFDGTPNPNLVGRDAAGPLLFSVIEGLRDELGRQGREPQVPYNLKQVDICPVSGALAGEHCPHRRKGLIVPGVSSLRTCVVHREVLIDVATGQRVCDESYRGVVRREVMEVWDSDLLKLFELAGLSRRTPPPFMQICPAPDAETRGARAPQILSPQEGVVYQLRPHQESERRIELSAVRDGGRSALFWFIDDELVGEGESVFWSGRPGSFTVRVVDDQGQVAVRTVQVQWAPG